jgi:hypothetical protein
MVSLHVAISGVLAYEILYILKLIFYSSKISSRGQRWWLMSVIPSTWEAEMSRTTTGGQLR